MPPKMLSDLAGLLTVRLVMTPREKFTTINSTKCVGEAKELMEANSYDQLPVNNDKGEIVGLVRIKNISPMSPDKYVANCIESSVLKIQDTENISKLFSLLQDETCVFVQNKHGEVIGLIHRSDLNKQGVRAYFYLWLAGFEMGLAERLKSEYEADDNWMTLLIPKKQKEIRKRWDEEKKEGFDLHLFEYTNLSDLISVVKKDKEKKVWSKLGFNNAKEWGKISGKLIKLRIDIMHPVKTIVMSVSDINRLKTCDESLRKLVIGLDLYTDRMTVTEV